MQAGFPNLEEPQNYLTMYYMALSSTHKGYNEDEQNNTLVGRKNPRSEQFGISKISSSVGISENGRM
jgi:hypothetical protein